LGGENVMHPWDRAFRVSIPVAGLAVGITVLAVGWFTQPDRFALGYAPSQPIPFSHRIHAGNNRIPCQYCHTGADRSRHAGVPPLQTCMNCHKVTKTDSPWIQKIAKMVAADEPIRWQRVYALPDHAYFDHRPHVSAGVECQTCHGAVQGMEVMGRVMNMRMGACLECHRNPAAALPQDSPIRRGPENCYACHR
jgi:hypothetical protein